MAKQKNIKIVYQVDTSQVKAAEATVGRAKAATDSLTKSTKQFGDQAKATGTQYKLTTSDLIGEMNLLKQKILDTATTDKQRLDQLIPKYRELKAQVDALNKSIDGTAKSSASVGVSLGGIYNAVRLALTAGLIRETANAVIEMTALAGKIEGVKRAFDKLPNSILLMEELRQRTHGALTELELMQKALQARNFGIPIEQLGKLLEFAAIKSQQTGISIQYLTDSIVTGLGRESIKILDNLQIDIGKLKKRMEETGLSMREVVGDIVNEELKKMGGYLKTGETAVNLLKSSWAGFGATVSKELAQSGFVEYLAELVQAADDFVKGQSMGGGIAGFDLARGLRLAREEAAKNVQQIKDSNKNIEEAISLNKERLFTNQQTVQALKDENKALTEKNKSFIGLQKLNTEEAKRIAHNERIIEALEHKIQVEGIEGTLLRELIKTRELENEMNKKGAMTVGDLDKKLEELQDQRKGMAVDDLAGIHRLDLEIQSVETLIARLNSLRNAKGVKGGDFQHEEFGRLSGEKSDKADDRLKDGLADIKSRGEARLRIFKKNNDAEEKEAERHKKYMERIHDMTVNMAINVAHSVLSAWSDSRAEDRDDSVRHIEEQIKKNDEFYDGMLEMVGDNSRKRSEIQAQSNLKRKELEKQAEQAEVAAEERSRIRERNARLRQIAIDTAAGIVRALTIHPGLPEGGPIALFLAAEGIAQAAIVRKFRRGVIDLNGPGNETSDSIPARLSKHESVMTAEETKSSMNILKGIRARKLDDRIFEKLVVKSPAMRPTDLSPVVSELQRNRPVGIVTQSVQIYEVMEKRKGLKKRIRNASGF